MPFTPGKWAARAAGLLASFSGPAAGWRSADAESVRSVVRGVSLYTANVKKDGAARVAFNISSAHAPAFAERGTGPGAGAAYLNRYDVRARLGSAPPAGLDARDLIDGVLAGLGGPGVQATQLYYGAAVLNGAGIRYYGDVCLTLKDQTVPADTLVLDRNSFDLILAPLRRKTHTGPGETWNSGSAETEADALAGHWGPDLADMAVCKVLKASMQEERRLTVGAVSEGVLSDEDYLEVIRPCSFGAADVAEARISAAEAAVDGLIADRLRRGPAPSWTELLWRHRRRVADSALRRVGVRSRVVVSSGRVRS